MAPITNSERYHETIDFWRDVYGINSKYKFFRVLHLAIYLLHILVWFSLIMQVKFIFSLVFDQILY